MNRSFWLILLLLSVLPSFGQSNDPVLPVKTPEEMTALLGVAFQRNSLLALSGPYHLLATFETFTRDGAPDGEGTIERWAINPRRMKTTTRFRGHTMTEYVNEGKPLYTDDGFGGSIMTYFVNEFLFHPLVPPPPSGLYRTDFQTKAIQMQGAALDCGTYQFYVVPAGSPFPPPPREVLCLAHDTHDLVLRQTLVFSTRYKEFAPFLDRSIPRYIAASEGSVVRCRIRIQQMDEAVGDEESFVAPAEAVPANPAPDWYATNAEPGPTHGPPILGRMYPSGSIVHAAPVSLLVLRSRTGAVQEAEPLNAMAPDLAKIAVARALEYKFQPLIRNGKPVDTLYTLRFFITK